MKNFKANKINFTKSNILNIPLPATGKIGYYYDQQVNGLGIMVFASSTKTFFLYRRVRGRPDKIKLGRFPEMSVEQARKAAYSMISNIEKGVNPKAEKAKAIEKDISFLMLFNNFMEKHSKLHKKKWKDDEDKYKLYLTHLANRKLSSINQAEIMHLQAHLAKNNSIYVANRVMSLLSAIFNKAISWGLLGISPYTGIKKFKEKSRERFLHGDELPKFFKALDIELNKVFRDFFYICLLTGARRGNVLSMNWKDINLERGTWHINEAKNGDSQTIPLSMEASKILESRFKDKINNWVFPSNTSVSGHIEEPKKAWKRVLKNAEIEDLRIHDLRRTLGSWQAATGANSFVIGKSLGHKSQAATAIYARLNLDPVRESVSRAISAMFAFTKSKNAN